MPVGIGGCRKADGDQARTRASVEILLAHRTLPAAVVTAALDQAIATGRLNPDLVLIEARRTADHTRGVVPAPVEVGVLDRYDRPPPSLAGYDTLFTRKAAP